jgi:hypothetical protein
MNLIKDQRLINLNSKNARKKNGTKNSNCIFDFNNVLDNTETDIAYAEIGLISAEIPVSFYIINELNDTLTMSVGGVSNDIQIDDGNYTGNNFISQWTSKITTAFTNIQTTTLSSTTGKLSIQNTGAQSIFLNKLGNNGLWELMGFDGATTTVEITAGSTFELPFLLNLLGVNKLMLNSYALATYNLDSANGGYSNTFFSLDVNVPSYGLLQYKNNSQTYSILRTESIDNIDIEILDQDLNVIDFNNQDWLLTLVINIYRYIPAMSNVGFRDAFMKQIEPKEKSGQKDLGNTETTDKEKKPIKKKDETLDFLEN